MLCKSTNPFLGIYSLLPRLLKVKPEERLTIEGVLDHPWLNSTEALDNILPSAQLMMDKVRTAGFLFLHRSRRALRWLKGFCDVGLCR